MSRMVMPLTVPVAIEAPAPMEAPVRQVLAGEYECGIYGEGLSILDIGANVGAFTLWAHRRWPRSRIWAYEPDPGTFAMLERNVGALPDVTLAQSAVYPAETGTIGFFSRYAGDGEAAVAECARSTFAGTDAEPTAEVPALHPSALPPADIVKIDAEGAEAAILAHMTLDRVSLVLLEYQNDSNRAAIKALLAPQFDILFEDEFDWDHLLGRGHYSARLRGDHFGHLFFLSRSNTKLRRLPAPAAPGAARRLVARLAGHARALLGGR